MCWKQVRITLLGEEGRNYSHWSGLVDIAWEMLWIKIHAQLDGSVKNIWMDKEAFDLVKEARLETRKFKYNLFFREQNILQVKLGT